MSHRDPFVLRPAKSKNGAVLAQRHGFDIRGWDGLRRPCLRNMASFVVLICVVEHYLLLLDLDIYVLRLIRHGLGRGHSNSRRVQKVVEACDELRRLYDHIEFLITVDRTRYFRLLYHHLFSLSV